MSLPQGKPQADRSKEQTWNIVSDHKLQDGRKMKKTTKTLCTMRKNGKQQSCPTMFFTGFNGHKITDFSTWCNAFLLLLLRIINRQVRVSCDCVTCTWNTVGVIVFSTVHSLLLLVGWHCVFLVFQASCAANVNSGDVRVGEFKKSTKTNKHIVVTCSKGSVLEQLEVQSGTKARIHFTYI